MAELVQAYTVVFTGMSGNNVPVVITPRELDRLLEQGLVEIKGTKIREVLLRELVEMDKPTVTSEPPPREEMR